MKRLVIILILVFTTVFIHANQKRIVDLEYTKDLTDKYHPRYYLVDDHGHDTGYYEIGYNGKRKKKNIIVNDFTTIEFYGKVNPDVLKEHYLNARKIKKYKTMLIISLAAILPGGILFGTVGVMASYAVFSVSYLLVILTGILVLIGVGAIITSFIMALTSGVRIIKYKNKNRQIIDDFIYQLNNQPVTDITIFNKKLSFK